MEYSPCAKGSRRPWQKKNKEQNRLPALKWLVLSLGRAPDSPGSLATTDARIPSAGVLVNWVFTGSPGDSRVQSGLRTLELARPRGARV